MYSNKYVWFIYEYVSKDMYSNKLYAYKNRQANISHFLLNKGENI